MTDYERDYTVLIERRLSRMEADRDAWRYMARVRLAIVLIARAGWLSTAVCK